MKLSTSKNLAMAALALSVSVPAFSDLFPQAPKAEPATLIVKYVNGSFANPQTRQYEIENFLGSPEVKPLGHLGTVADLPERTQVVRFSSNLDPMEAAHELAQNSSIEWAQPNYYLYAISDDLDAPVAHKTPSFMRDILGMRDVFGDDGDQPAKKPGYQTPPDLPGTRIEDPRIAEAWGLKAVHAPEAWTISHGDRKIVVADIDTGIDYNHEDLMNNLWTNPNPDATKKDLHGYDFIAKDGMPWDDHSHGTHTAGTIGAVGGNGVGVSGVAQDVSIMALKFLSGGGYGSTADAILAIDYAIEHKARVMSNSWGGGGGEDGNKALAEAVARANKADILFVAAAGNDSSDNDVNPTYPASIQEENVLTVAATTPTDELASFSNYGLKTVHVAAPGSGVLSTVPGNDYKKFSGTSMACPHVSGVAALILAVNPKLKAVEVKKIIMETVDPIQALDGKIVTGGRVNAKKALERARGLGSDDGFSI